MALVGQRFLLTIGGNDGRLFPYVFIWPRIVLSYLLTDCPVLRISNFNTNNTLISGKRPLADVWALDTAAKPYEWRKLEPEGEGPPPCM
jgi:hypothetical protein